MRSQRQKGALPLSHPWPRFLASPLMPAEVCGGSNTRGDSRMEFLMQLIRRTAVMEEVNHSELPMEPLLYPAVATGAEELPPMATVSVDGQVCAPDVAAAAEGVDEPQASEQSIGQTDPKTPWLDSQTSLGSFKNEVRDGLGLEDRIAENGDAINQLPTQGAFFAPSGDGAITAVDDDANSANETGNTLAGLIAPKKRKEMGCQQLAGRKRQRGSASGQGSAQYVASKGTSRQPARAGVMPETCSQASKMQKLWH